MPSESINPEILFLLGGYVSFKEADLLRIMLLGLMRVVWSTCYPVSSWPFPCLTWSGPSITNSAASTVVIKPLPGPQTTPAQQESGPSWGLENSHLPFSGHPAGVNIHAVPLRYLPELPLDL